MSQAEADKITVSCSCGKKLKAPASAVGRKAKCPGCGNVMTLTAPTTKKESTKAGADDDGLDGLYALAAEEKQAAKHQGTATDDGMHCPSCGADMAPGAVLCVGCGFDMRTKAKVSKKPAATAAAAPGAPGAGGRGGSIARGYGAPARKDKVVDALAPQGKFVVGVGMSVLFAIGGAIIWFLVAFFSGYELFFLALVVGGAAGVGMQYGQQGYSTLGGITAAGVTFAMLVISKIAIFIAVLVPLMGMVSDAMDDDEVTQYVRDEELRKKGIEPDGADLEQFDDAAKSARKKAKKLTDAERKEIEAKIQKQKDEEELLEYLESEVAQNVDMTDEGAFNYIANQAKARLAAMTPQQQEQALAQYRAKAKAEHDAAMAEFQKEMAQMQAQAAQQPQQPAAEDDEEAEDETEVASAAGEDASEEDEMTVGDAAKTGLFLLFIYLLIDWKGVLFMLGAMFFAYRTAAGSVHD